MKRAVSISIGSSKRNKAVTVKLLGEDVSASNASARMAIWKLPP